MEVFSKKEAKHKNKVFWDINQLLELKYEDAEKSIKLQFRKSKQKNKYSKSHLDENTLSFLRKILVRRPMGDIQKPVSVYQHRYQNTAK